MIPTRRHFLKSAAAAGTLAAVPTASVYAKNKALRAEGISALFAQLPGDVAFKILAPNAKGRKAFVAQRNSDRMLFVASAIKTFVLCEALRQACRNARRVPAGPDAVRFHLPRAAAARCQRIREKRQCRC